MAHIWPIFPDSLGVGGNGVCDRVSYPRLGREKRVAYRGDVLAEISSGSRRKSWAFLIHFLGPIQILIAAKDSSNLANFRLLRGGVEMGPEIWTPKPCAERESSG